MAQFFWSKLSLFYLAFYLYFAGFGMHFFECDTSYIVDVLTYRPVG